MIPKIIHQIWLGSSKPPSEAMDSWKIKHPDWEYILWDENEIKNQFPNGLYNEEDYERLEHNSYAGQADILRYEILYYFGGIYIDADATCLNSLDDFFLRNDSFGCFESEKYRPNLISNGFLGATKRNKLMKFLVENTSKRSRAFTMFPKESWGGHIWSVYGPMFLTETVFNYNYTSFNTYPSWYFLPTHYQDFNETYSGPDKVYATHEWKSTQGLFK